MAALLKCTWNNFFLFSKCSDERVLKESSRKSQLGPGKKKIFGLEKERKKLAHYSMMTMAYCPTFYLSQATHLFCFS
jgi:hypothetical protein